MCVAYTALLNGQKVVLKTPLPDTSHAAVAANDLEVRCLGCGCCCYCCFWYCLRLTLLPVLYFLLLLLLLVMVLELMLLSLIFCVSDFVHAVVDVALAAAGFFSLLVPYYCYY